MPLPGSSSAVPRSSLGTLACSEHPCAVCPSCMLCMAMTSLVDICEHLLCAQQGGWVEILKFLSSSPVAETPVAGLGWGGPQHRVPFEGSDNLRGCAGTSPCFPPIELRVKGKDRWESFQDEPGESSGWREKSLWFLHSAFQMSGSSEWDWRGAGSARNLLNHKLLGA